MKNVNKVNQLKGIIWGIEEYYKIITLGWHSNVID